MISTLYKINSLENLSRNSYYVTIETSDSLMNVLKKLDNKVNLVQFYRLEIIPDFRNLGLSGGGELFKIINNSYGVRWLLWTKTTKKIYVVFAWNINEPGFFIKEI